MDCDIAIIGYGPVGATAAPLLGGSGLKVVVVERMAGIYDKPRAITADHEIMRVMQFAGIGNELGRHIRPHPGTRYLGLDGGTIKQTDVIPPPYPLGWPTGIHFIQPEFEGMLRNAVARHTNVTALLEHEVSASPYLRLSRQPRTSIFISISPPRYVRRTSGRMNGSSTSLTPPLTSRQASVLGSL